MPRIQQQLTQQAAGRHWFSPGMVVAAVGVAAAHSMGYKLTTWWVWLLAVIASIIVDVLLGVTEHRVIRAPMTSEYGKGVQDEDDDVR